MSIRASSRSCEHLIPYLPKMLYYHLIVMYESECGWICKIVSKEQRRDFRLEELKTFLISCYYPQELINQAINTAKDQNNSFTLNLQNSDIIPLVITNNPNHTIDFNHIKNLINNVKCPRLKRAFKNKPLLSTRQPPNLKRLLTRAEYNPEEEQGVIPCTRPNCDLCRLGYLKIQLKLSHQLGQLYLNFTKGSTATA